MYPILRDILFNFDAEAVHHFSMSMLKGAAEVGLIQKELEKQFQFLQPSLAKDIFGLKFINPVGLGAGFDKNALYLKEFEMLGFGFVEIGTVTPLPQKGNDKPRLFRLPIDKAIINRMGFNNDGVRTISNRLKSWFERERNPNYKTPTSKLIIGGNIGKNKMTANEDAWKDYETCFNELFDCVDYFVVNVSSPNTPGLRELQEKGSLLKILSQLQVINEGKSQPKPLLLKIAPDLSHKQIDDIIDLAGEVKLSGIVATNTTIERSKLFTPVEQLQAIGAGGLSGKPLKNKSTEIVQYINQQTNCSLPIIASGGIFTGADAKEKLDAGASLIQVWTGFIYEGPSIVKNICKYLAN